MILIVAQARPEVRASTVAEEILRIRPSAWPNLRIIEIGDAMLGRDGELIGAVRGIYRTQLKIRSNSDADAPSPSDGSSHVP